MSGPSVGHSHPRPCSGKKTLRKCRNKEKADKVIFIDVDSGIYDNVVIIDVPESFPKRNQDARSHKKDKKWLFKNVINLDDDETPESSSSPLGANNVSFSASTPLNRESFRVAEEFGDSKDAQDSATPVRLSKCKRTYSGKASTSNRYGLDSDSDGDLSGNDYPDCEVVEDFSGKFQELWEKAVSRRRKDIHSGIKGHDSTSSNINKDRQNGKSENKARHNEEDASFCHATGKCNTENGGSSPVRTEKDDVDFTHASDNVLNDQEHSASGKFKSLAELLNCEPGSSSSCSGRGKHQASSNLSLQEEPNKKFDNPICTSGDKENSREENKDALLLVTEDCPSPVGDCITNEREKLKETDEYRKAMEEEWASRQESLRAQAEEVQRERKLRKRRKAETMRLQDVEQRQKQRLEEMRSIQKKDEEDMNMKEMVRAEVRNQLKVVEVGCHNMASLLHLLGLTVGSWPNPSPQEVQAAYKRALLTFHPDRAPRSGIRQMVEAEEKFKLINRMKEKFPLSV